MKDIESNRKTFVEAWASMASLFSFSPSTGRVCGLLISSAEPLSLSEISDRLSLSRGNVSMCLKELRAWGVVQRVPRPGDRREFYESRGDLFEQTLAIARERKRREFDPVAGTALEALRALARDAPEEDAKKLGSVSEYLTTIDRIGREVLDNEQAAAALIGLIKRGFGPGHAPQGTDPPAQGKESR
jgi:DNA-binding transcriptional regulator GbsR (MarR family)